MKKLALAAALLLIPSLAFGQTFWNPQNNYVYRDGGNDPLNVYPVLVGNHGVATTNAGFPIGVTTSFTANFGTVIASDTQGTDTDFSVNLYTPASGQGAVAAQTAVFVVNFGQAYAVATQTVADGGAVPMYGGICVYAGAAAGTPGVSTLYGLPTGSGATMTFYNSVAFTPAASTNYHWVCHVFNVGTPY